MKYEPVTAVGKMQYWQTIGFFVAIQKTGRGYVSPQIEQYIYKALTGIQRLADLVSTVWTDVHLMNWECFKKVEEEIKVQFSHDCIAISTLHPTYL